MKLFNKYLVITYLSLIILLIALGSGLSLYPLAHYMVLIGWIVISKKNLYDSRQSLILSLVLYILGSALSIVGLREFSEEIMRIFLIFFAVGLSQAFLEYKRGVRNAK